MEDLESRWRRECADRFGDDRAWALHAADTIVTAQAARALLARVPESAAPTFREDVVWVLGRFHDLDSPTTRAWATVWGVEPPDLEDAFHAQWRRAILHRERGGPGGPKRKDLD